MSADQPFFAKAVAICLLWLSAIFSAGCSRDDHPGKTVYLKNCSQCHGITGQGLKNLYPPLHDSLFLSTRIGELPCLIIDGSSGAGKSGRASSFMPPIPSINQDNILPLLDFLQVQWADSATSINQSMLEQWLSSCKLQLRSS